MNRAIPVVATLLGCLCAASVFADSCKYSAERKTDADAAPVRKVVLGAGAGDLVVRGEEGMSGFSARGRACASSQALLDEIQIEVRREGDTVYLKTLLAQTDDGVIFGFTRYAYLDLTVSVPRSVEISLEDSSGDLELSGVSQAAVIDSSGDQTLRDIGGDLDVIDSSGELRIERVAGRLRLKDSSGDIEVDDVKGDVEVTVDSSGEIGMKRIQGGVHILTDGSGDIRLSDVQRDVTIDVDTSGDIDVDRVGGSFTVGADGSGGISHDRVVGAVRLPER